MGQGSRLSGLKLKLARRAQFSCDGVMGTVTGSGATGAVIFNGAVTGNATTEPSLAKQWKKSLELEQQERSLTMKQWVRSLHRKPNDPIIEQCNNPTKTQNYKRRCKAHP